MRDLPSPLARNRIHHWQENSTASSRSFMNFKFTSFKPSLCSLLFFTIAGPSLIQIQAQEKAHLKLDSPFASYVEADFPFFSQTLDARKFGTSLEKQNLTPRGIIIPAGNGFYACFDPDMLRWALFWKESSEGEYLTMDGMGTGSYRLPNRKSEPGQKNLPHPLGSPVLAFPLKPGVSIGEQPVLDDPRDRGHAEQDELGIGPIPYEQGRFSGLRLIQDGAQIEYTIGSTQVLERLSSNATSIIRRVEVGPHEQAVHLRTGPGDSDWLTLAASPTATHHQITITDSGSVKVDTVSAKEFPTSSPPEKRWKTSVKTDPAIAPQKDGAWVFDDLPLPVPNPWKRNVRLADVDFFPDGRAALLTFDGDVWIASGTQSGSPHAEWSRYASGMHEPQSLAIVKDQILVFDRNGIIRLHDTDQNGEADWHENVSNIFAQSAETRQYAMDFIPTPDGSFYVALGGQIGSSVGKQNGTVIKIAPDGLSYEVIATGLRQPYLGYDAATDTLTASDQQGNWKPATPIYHIKPGRYFGFQPEKYRDNVTHPASITPPEVWIPHFINQSGASQVWLKQTHADAKPMQMGALNDALIHIGYNRPEIFKIYLDANGNQGAVMPLLSGFPAGLLNGRVHPLDGQLYVTGFQIFGSSGDRISGLFRVRPGKTKAWLPREILAEKRGLLLRFDEPLTPALASELGRYSADRWNYQQTYKYGSGNYKLDGKPGQDAIPVLSAKLSADAKSIFLGIGDMQPSHALRFTYRLPAPDVTQVENVYLTVHQLPTFDLRKLGFEDDKVDLTPRALLAGESDAPKPTAELGKEISTRFGCIACHATGDQSLPGAAATTATATGGATTAVGPAWIGLWDSKRTFTDGSELLKVDEAYLRESILDPARRVQKGFEMERTGVGMPSYLGVLKDHEIDSIVLYIKALRKK